jgi:hypothetical protein
MPTSEKIKESVYATKSALKRVEDKMDKGFEEVNKNIKEMNEVMIQSFHFVYDRIEDVKSGMNTRFDSVNTRLDNVILDMPKRSEHNKLVKRVEVLEKRA